MTPERLTDEEVHDFRDGAVDWLMLHEDDDFWKVRASRIKALCEEVLESRALLEAAEMARANYYHLLSEGGDAIPLGPEKEVPDELGWWLGANHPVANEVEYFSLPDLERTKDARWRANTRNDGPWRRLLLDDKMG